jgi:hypothetical protein
MNEKSLNSIKKSREIVKEILNYGVSEEDKINIIKLVSLELENNNLMKDINCLILQEDKQEDNIKKQLQI